MPDRDIIDAVNKKTYANAEVVRCYDELDFIHEPERVMLEQLRPLIKDKSILDIGIGGGRTTKYLLEISRDYTGIDYTPGCVAAAKRKYTEANILCCDARDLRVFAAAAFDFVLFSFNSIDYVGHEDRLKVLREIRRVLKPGGFFMFSTHNRDYRYFNRLPWQEKPELSRRYVKSWLYSLYYLPKHLRMRKHEVHTDEYAIINDNAHGYSLLAYYISPGRQVRQLMAAGFVEVAVYDMAGRRVDGDDAFPWVYYLARKPPA